MKVPPNRTAVWSLALRAHWSAAAARQKLSGEKNSSNDNNINLRIQRNTNST